MSKIVTLPRWQLWTIVGSFAVVFLGQQYLDDQRLQHRAGVLQTQLDEVSSQLKTAKEELAGNIQETKKVKGNLEILDGAVNADSKRKMKILRVRNMVSNIIRTDHLEEASKKLDPYRMSELAAAIVDSCEKYDLPVPLLAGLLRQESAFNPDAEHPDSGAQGLGQLIPSTADEIRVRLQRNYYNPFKISHNVEFAATYLAEMYQRFGHDYQKALWAYNAGPNLVTKYLGKQFSNLPIETVKYEQSISAFRKQYEAYGVK